MQPPPGIPSAHPIHRGFLQTFGLDVRAAVLAYIVDQMVFSITIASFGYLLGVEVAAGVVLSYITYKIQRHWYGDEHHSALIKGLIVGLVTAIPVPLSSTAVVLPAGLLGLVQLFLPRRGS
jgi:hypothetical protein